MSHAISVEYRASNSGVARFAGFARATNPPQAFAIALSLLAHAMFAVVAYAHSATAVQVRPERERSIEVTLDEGAKLVPLPTPATHSDKPAPNRPQATARVPQGTPRVVPERTMAGSEPGVAATSVASAFTQTPSFTLRAPVVTGDAALRTLAAENAVTAELGAAPLSEHQVDRPARLQSGSPPRYTAAAEAAGLELELPLEVVVDRAGSVQSARALVARVGYGLDEAALSAIRSYRFSPALRAGKPVAVRMRWVLRFQLR